MIPLQVKKILDKYGLKALEAEENATPNCALAAKAFSIDISQCAKSILFKTKNGKFVMILLSGSKKVNAKKLKELLGCRADMTGEEETLNVTGYPIGGVCPFGLPETSGIKVYIDDSLKVFDILMPACGTRNACVKMTYKQLLEITAAPTCDVAA